MSANLISKVLLVSFDDTQVRAVQKLRGVLEKEQSIEIYDFNDIHHVYKREPSYASKLKLLLDGAKLSILVTSHKISDIQEADKLLDVFKDIGLDDDASQMFLSFFNIEMNKGIEETKLIFLSLGNDIEVFGDVNHLKNMLLQDYVNDHQVIEIVTKCRRSLRPTFPIDNKKEMQNLES